MTIRPLLVRPVFALALMPALGGCVASAVVGAVTAPVRVAGKVVDVATVSQSEADEKRGRELRHHEEAMGKLSRKIAEAHEDCADGDDEACTAETTLRHDYERLRDQPY